METLKKIINMAAMVYLVVAALIYLNILNIGQSEPGFYTTFFVIGGIIMLLLLIIENLYEMSLKRGYTQYQHKINELKANLYDQKQELQDLKNRQAEVQVVKPEIVPEQDNHITFEEPITAPVGTPPQPQDVTPVTDEPDTNQVIITPSPTPGIQAPDRRLPENSESDQKHDRNF